ncbi:hypothetical protein ACP4OV_005109 [Aristida adscensionis]
MRRFFPFRSFTSNGGNGQTAPANDTRNENKMDEHDTNGASRSPGTRSFRSRNQHGAWRNEESSHPQLRRCLSFTSSAIDRSLDERIMNFSRDIPCSMSNGSDAPRHLSDTDRYTCSPERHPNGGGYTINVPQSHGSQETDSPRSRCYSCSTGHSPVSSPVALKCRPARLTKLLNKNEALDLYIDGEQEVTRSHEIQKQNLPIRSTAPYLGRGRPPRPHSTAPSSPKSCKEIIEHSYIGIDDIWQSQHAHEGLKTTCKAASMCNEGGNDEKIFQASSENLSQFDECKAQSITTAEDIYEDVQYVQPPGFYSTTMDFTASTTSRYFAVDLYPHDECHSFCDNNLDRDIDEKLLRRAKELNCLPNAENSELKTLRDKRLNSTEMLQMIRSLIEHRKQLASELSSQIKARLTERFEAKEQYRRSKVELNTQTRRLEKEKTGVKNNLERELDRRSNDWSVKLEKFQSEEQRVREKVRELAEQNVSFQREITLLESDKADASNRIASLEQQNKGLNNELQRVKSDRNNLHNFSVELHDNFRKAAEEMDRIQVCLREKEEDSKALYKVIARLQRVSNEQEKTINGLRQGLSAELEKGAAGSSDSINRRQMELVRITGVEEKLRRELQSCTLEMESLRQENIEILYRLQRSEVGSSFNSIRLEQELHTRVEILQTQGLSLLDDAVVLCADLLDLIQSKRSEDSESFDALAAIGYALRYQRMKEGIENVKRSLRTIKSVLLRSKMKEKLDRALELIFWDKKS